MNERGIALILTLFLTAAASALAGSLMYLSQTETYATSNYRVMTQARYGAESGIHKAINFLLNTYATPGTVADPLANYNRTVSPVTYDGQPVVLSANDDVESNYPVAAVAAQFAANAAGTLMAGSMAVVYRPHATLLSMRLLDNGTVALSWEITSVGRIAVGSATAEVEVSSVLERMPNPLPPTTSYSGNNQTLVNGASVGNVTASGGSTLTLGAPGVTSTIAVNSIKLSGGSTLVVLGTVVLNVAGTSQTNPIDLSGGTISNASLDPSRFQIRYGGTGGVKGSGGTRTAAVLNTPNASVSLSGGTSFYGAIIGSDITVSGGARIHYDTNLANTMATTSAGPDMLSSFTWKKY